MVQRIAILGSTGSIGQQALDIISAFPERWQVIALAAGSNAKLLEEQIAIFKPTFVFNLGKRKIEGARYISLDEMAALPEADIVLVALGGSSGLEPTLSAARAGKVIALANKESLVMAGEIITSEVKRNSTEIRPIDSEHSAIWQCLKGEPPPRRIILTASGGPFLNYPLDELDRVTPEEALKHPSWKMGKKVTIDSATMLNKGLEIIEAHHLFDIEYDKIEVLVHSQSIVHAIVEFVDGSVKAELALPDMRLPIQYALSYPERLENKALPQLDLSRLGELSFRTPDLDKFPCLKLARTAGEKGGTYPAAMVAADDVLVDLFLKETISFTDIPRYLEEILSSHRSVPSPELGDILEAASWAKEKVKEMIKKCGSQ
jgi:1-deoxy-D-xylulose-5-phosphate reductoisomerase